MSGGSQHNPNGRQSQLGPGWSPLQLQVANLLARAPQVHMATERGVTWHTPTPPPHLYHVPAPSPPDPLQSMKNAGSNSVFRHTATPPELYRHTPTPPDKHLMRHTPSPGDVKSGPPLSQAELYPHLGPGRDKLRPEDLLAYARVGVDLSLGGSRSASNGSPAPPAHPSSPALSVRDAPTINSLIARAQPHQRLPHARVDALLERLVPSPVSPHSVIMHSRAAPTPSPPSSNEDSADSCGAAPGSKRKRKPERTIRVPAPPPAPAPSSPLAPAAAPAPAPAPAVTVPSPAVSTPSPAPTTPVSEPVPMMSTGDDDDALEIILTKAWSETRLSKAQAPAPAPEPAPASSEPSPSSPASLPPRAASPAAPLENGDTPHAKHNGPDKPASPPRPPARRKTRPHSGETIDDIAAMIASTDRPEPVPIVPSIPPPIEPVTVDNLKSVLASPEPKTEVKSPPRTEEKEETPQAVPAAAPRRRSARTSNSEANVPVESPSEAKPAEAETSGAPTAEPIAASFVEVENQLEKMFAGIEEPTDDKSQQDQKTPRAKKRRKSAPTKGERKASRHARRASTIDEGPRRKAARKKETTKAKKTRDNSMKDAYDSGSNASSSRSRGPYIQIRGPRDSPLSVSVINATTGEDDEASAGRRKTGDDFRNGLRARGLHASTLGLRYDASTPDLTWLCVFCEKGPHAAGLGDLFGPYTVDTDCEEYRALDEATRVRYSCNEVWFHEACGVWAPGLVAAGARVWGLAGAVWAARAQRCGHCGAPPAALACAARHCRARAHLPCARAHRWALCARTFHAYCPAHAAH